MKLRAILFTLFVIVVFPAMVSAIPTLSVSPLLFDKSCSETTDTIYITNTGSDTLNWTALVATTDTSWLSIVGNSTGVDNGFIIIHLDPNPGPLRTGSINIESPGATGSPQLVEVVQHNCTAPNWSYAVTGSSHTILLQSTAQLSIDNVPLVSGDYVGVFTETTTGDLLCAGYTEYTGASSIVVAWEDDALTPQKDGFLPGNTFNWKLWRASDGQEFMATASYMPILSPITSQETYQTGGMSGLLSLGTVFTTTQLIELPGGWGFFSTYIDPPNPALEAVLSDIINNVVIVKNDIGMVYWPAFGVNVIGGLNIGEGYQIRTNISDTLAIEGTQIVPETTGIVIPAGWNFIAYLRTSPASIVNMIDPISTNTILVKNYIGQVYWLAFGVNVIGDMIPGQGYQIKMSAQDTLYYPAN
jgi:hypothetical protein